MRSIDVASPRKGRASATCGCSTDGLPANPSRLSAPTTSWASSSRAVSARASAPIPTESELPLSSASASPRSEHQPARLQRVDQLGHGRQVGLAERSDRRQPRRQTVVERGHERLGHLRAHHAAAPAERVHPVQQRRASHLSGQRVAVRGAVRLDREPREAPGVLCGLAHPAQGAHPRVQAVDGLVALGQASRQLRRRSHPPGCLTGQRHRQAVAGDRRHVLHGQPGAGQDQLVHALILRVCVGSA